MFFFPPEAKQDAHFSVRRKKGWQCENPNHQCSGDDDAPSVGNNHWKLFENEEVMEVGEAHSRTLSPLISPSPFNQVPAGLPTPPAFCTR